MTGETRWRITIGVSESPRTNGPPDGRASAAGVTAAPMARTAAVVRAICAMRVLVDTRPPCEVDGRRRPSPRLVHSRSTDGRLPAVAPDTGLAMPHAVY